MHRKKSYGIVNGKRKRGLKEKNALLSCDSMSLKYLLTADMRSIEKHFFEFALLECALKTNKYFLWAAKT